MGCRVGDLEDPSPPIPDRLRASSLQEHHCPGLANSGSPKDSPAHEVTSGGGGTYTRFDMPQPRVTRSWPSFRGRGARQAGWSSGHCRQRPHRLTPSLPPTALLLHRYAVARAIWADMLSIAVTYFITLCLFPGLESEVRHCVLGEWLPILIMAVFNLSDFVGKASLQPLQGPCRLGAAPELRTPELPSWEGAAKPLRHPRPRPTAGGPSSHPCVCTPQLLGLWDRPPKSAGRTPREQAPRRGHKNLGRVPSPCYKHRAGRGQGWSRIKAAISGAGLMWAFFRRMKNVRLREGKPFAQGHTAEPSEK